MSEPKPEPAEGPAPAAADEGARVRAQLGEGLRKFYDSVLEEPLPTDWLKIVGAPPEGGGKE